MRTIFLVHALALLLVGCSRALPDPSPGSSLDPASAAPDPAAVGVALSSDPPLPGESREGWSGLGESKPNHHHHHHGKSSKPDAPAEGGGHAH